MLECDYSKGTGFVVNTAREAETQREKTMKRQMKVVTAAELQLVWEDGDAVQMNCCMVN